MKLTMPNIMEPICDNLVKIDTDPLMGVWLMGNKQKREQTFAFQQTFY